MFAEDLSVFFSDTEHAHSATLAAAAGTVIYSENGLELGDLGVQTVGPTALCPATQWPAAADGQTLVVAFQSGARSFKVRSVTLLDDGSLVLLTLAEI